MALPKMPVAQKSTNGRLVARSPRGLASFRISLPRFPDEKVPHEKAKLPKRQTGDYIEPDYPYKRVPEVR